VEVQYLTPIAPAPHNTDYDNRTGTSLFQVCTGVKAAVEFRIIFAAHICTAA
jgi:hypothetical protein